MFDRILIDVHAHMLHAHIYMHRCVGTQLEISDSPTDPKSEPNTLNPEPKS